MNGRAGVAVVALVLAGARAASAGPAEEAARAHFERGGQHFERREYVDAAREYEAAYAAFSKFSILRNLALAYDALGKPVEAADAMERYLRDGGSAITSDVRRDAESFLRTNKAKIAKLSIKAPVGALIRIGGKEVGTAPLPAPLRVAAGRVVVIATLKGHELLEREVTLLGGETKTLELELRPTLAKGALVQVNCPVPGVAISVDGEPVGNTPLPAPVAVAPGTRELAFERPGYEKTRTQVIASAAELQRVSCIMREDPKAPANLRGTLLVEPSVDDATVLVDGKKISGEVTIPIGPHAVEVTRAGYTAWSGVAQVDADAMRVFRVRLEPKEAYRDSVASRRGWQTAAAVGLIAGGAIVGGLGYSKYRSLGESADDADAQRNQLAVCAGTLTKQQCDQQKAEEERLRLQADDYNKRKVNAGVLYGIAAGALIATGVVVWLTVPSGLDKTASRPGTRVGLSPSGLTVGGAW